MEENKKEFLFNKDNYKYLFIGIALVFVGFLLMIGGASDNPNEFNEDALFGFRRITLAPLLVLGGFGVVLYSIMKKSKED